MILYNTTFIVDTHAVDSFKAWVSASFIPAALESGIFLEPLLTRIIPPADMAQEDSVCSFALQFKADDHTKATIWNEEIAPTILQPLALKHGAESILSFTTFMEIL